MTDLITKRTTYDWVLEFLSWIGIFFALIPLGRYNEIPDKAIVPVHFDFRGAIDAWGNKEYILCYSFHMYSSSHSVYSQNILSAFQKAYDLL